MYIYIYRWFPIATFDYGRVILTILAHFDHHYWPQVWAGPSLLFNSQTSTKLAEKRRASYRHALVAAAWRGDAQENVGMVMIKFQQNGNYTLESVDSIIFYHLLVLNVGNGASWHDVESSFGLDHESPFPRALSTCHGAGETPSETWSPNKRHQDNALDSFLKCVNPHLQWS